MIRLYLYKAVVTSVYDGDTVTVDIDLGFGIWMKGQKMRLMDVDAPELRGGTEETKSAARASRDYLRSLILDKEVEIETVKDRKGKYGRWLAYILFGDIDVNMHMIEKGHAKFVSYR